MAAHAITLQLPAPLYDHFRNRAERAHRSLESEILDVVATVAADEDELAGDVVETLAALELLNDEELWRAARNRLPEEDRAQLESLNLKQQREGLAPAEKEQLERLVHRYDRAVLVRAEAARLLKARGHDVAGLLAAR